MPQIVREEDKIIFTHQNDNTETYVTTTLQDGFRVVWGDYIANAWEEEYVSLGTALARAAVIIECSNSMSSWGFEQPDAETFSYAWQDALETFVGEYDGHESALDIDDSSDVNEMLS